MVCGLVINRLVKYTFMGFNFKYLYYTSVRSSNTVLLPIYIKSWLFLASIGKALCNSKDKMFWLLTGIY